MRDINYLKAQEDLLRGLPSRTKDIIERRFGLKKEKRETLESIGRDYKVCRERIRQIESKGLEEIEKRIKNLRYQKIFDDFTRYLKRKGGAERKDLLLSHLGGKFKNQVFFLLTFCDKISFFKETDDFFPFFALSKEDAKRVKRVIEKVVRYFEKKKKTLEKEKLFSVFQKDLGMKEIRFFNKNIFFNYLAISKRVAQGPKGLFGLKEWPEILPKGVKDKAYVVFKIKSKPLHFREVANLINNLELETPFSKKKVLPATVHNELIRDPRFVLVGKGLYALREWGYEPGFVRDVIFRLIKKEGRPLSREEIVKKVLAQRLVKENTVILNLHNKEYFIRDSNGDYTIKEV